MMHWNLLNVSTHSPQRLLSSPAFWVFLAKMHIFGFGAKFEIQIDVVGQVIFDNQPDETFANKRDHGWAMCSEFR